MTQPTPEQETRERRCYGATILEIEANYEYGSRLGRTREFYAVSILSDVQEVLAHAEAAAVTDDGAAKTVEYLEFARQWINRAKYFIAAPPRG